MTITELMPTVKKLPYTDKLLLLQILVQDLLQAEGVTPAQPIDINLLASVSPSDDDDEDLSIEERLAILRKPPAERGRILAEQAEAMQTHYEQNIEWQDWPVEDIVEY